MAQITIHLPDDLHDMAERVGLDVAAICQRAVVVESARLRAALDVPARDSGDARAGRRTDDKQRFQRGMELGMGWARGARQDEVDEIVVWGGFRWRQFNVDPATNSLPAAYCRDNRLDAPASSEPYWFERDAYTVGMVQGVVAASRRPRTAAGSAAPYA